MKTMPISKFKAHALEVIKAIAANKESIIITKRNKPMAEVRPFAGSTEKPELGKLASALVSEGDIILILSYCHVEDEEALNFKPRLVYVDGKNSITRVKGVVEAVTT